jgi:hypothetical protein
VFRFKCHCRKTSSKILVVLNAEDDKYTIRRNVGNYTMSNTVTFEKSETTHQATQRDIPYDLWTQPHGSMAVNVLVQFRQSRRKQNDSTKTLKFSFGLWANPVRYASYWTMYQLQQFFCVQKRAWWPTEGTIHAVDWADRWTAGTSWLSSHRVFNKGIHRWKKSDNSHRFNHVSPLPKLK